MSKIYRSLCVIMAATAIQSGAKPLALADPFILYHDGMYYAYGTNHQDGILVYTSTDLIHWKKHGFALHKSDTWADRYFWAPEIYHINGRFLMYFTADYHISAAWADSPLGPFIQPEKKPMWDTRGIDHSLFIDPDGKPYIFWNLSAEERGIFVAELEDDLITIKGDTIRHCFGPQQPWEVVENLISEGPFCISHEGKFILTYSANDYRSKDYGVGAAEADSPLGPWKKYENNPLLHRPDGLVGTGHHSFFHDKDGKMWVVFHAHNSDTEIHPRLTYIAEVTFVDGKMQISPDYIALQVEE